MSFYTCFDWFKKLRLFVNVQNLKINVVLKTSRAVAIGGFSLNEAPLGLFRFISDYLLRGLHSVYNLILHEPNKNCNQSLNAFFI